MELGQPSVDNRVASQLLWLVLCIATIVSASPTAAAEPRSTRDLTALAPPAADRAVRKDLLSVLAPISERLSSGMRLRLSEIPLSTRPYGTEFAGLCARDTLSLKYAPIDLTGRPEDQPLQAYGLEAVTSFHALYAPRALGDRAAQLNLWSAECDRLGDQPTATWFAAANADDAARSMVLLKAATDRIKAGDLKPSCDTYPAEKRSCSQVVLDVADLQNVFSVSSCQSSPGSECFTIELADIELTVVGRLGEDGASIVSVESVVAQLLIVVT